MAKAKKPTPGDKPASQTSKTAAEKGAGDAEKGTETSSASKAAAAKADKTASAKESDKSSGSAAAGKPETSKAAAASGETSSAAKPATSPKTDASKTADATKSETAKTEASKPSTAEPAAPKPGDKAASDKPPVAPAKKEATAKSDDKSTVSATSAPAPQKQPQRSQSVFWPFVGGGVVAAALGFAASEANVFNTRVETTEIRESVEKQQQQIAALEDAAPAAPDLSGIEADLASIAENVATIEIRLTALENRPAPSGDAPAPTADYSEELAALTASVSAQKAEIDRLLENAQSIEEATAEAARRAAIQSALTNISAALNAGGSYSNEVGALSESGVDEVPEAIAVPAEEGVATLLSLQTEFPDTARAALAAARAAGVDGDDGGVGSFLRRQLGARSVAPREGSDPDAVLSRAEAALREGRLADALSELETLPPEAQAAMQAWLSDARARVEAEAAVDDLSQRLTAN